MKSSAVLIHRLGPYHHARLRAAGGRGNVTAIEISASGGSYAWRRVAGADSFKKITLFEQCDSDSWPGAGEVARRVRAALEEASPDAVFVPGWSDVGALAALDWCRTTRTPAVVMSDSHAIGRCRHRLRTAVKRRITRLYSAALVGGTAQAEYLASLGMPRERIFMGYDVVDNSHFARGAEEVRRDPGKIRRRLDLPEQYFLVMNRFIWEKNLPGVLDAYARCLAIGSAPKWKLVIVGNGPVKPQLLRQAADAHLGDNLVLVGFRQYDELPAYYGLASALILASVSETWGLVVNEAMASGLPVLVSERCGCAPDLVKPGVNGFTFDPYDIDALAGHMPKMAGGEHDLAAMGRASREIISHWTPETFADGLLSAAEAAIAVPRPRATVLDRSILWGLMRR